ncbi:hypothetical protein D3C87_617990 [compost metagenome]|nr:hypothetical protein [Stenotrophomonas sp.]
MRPEDLLADHQDHVQRDGITVRKGSVGAFLANARVLQDPAASAGARASAACDLRALLPGLHALGLFEILVPRDPALRALVDAGR